jgi:hypothetical protein
MRQLAGTRQRLVEAAQSQVEELFRLLAAEVVSRRGFRTSVGTYYIARRPPSGTMCGRSNAAKTRCAISRCSSASSFPGSPD